MTREEAAETLKDTFEALKMAIESLENSLTFHCKNCGASGIGFKAPTFQNYPDEIEKHYVPFEEVYTPLSEGEETALEKLTREVARGWDKLFLQKVVTTADKEHLEYLKVLIKEREKK